MNDTIVSKDPIDLLDQKALLQLASGASAEGSAASRFALPDDSQLAELFPEL